MFIPISDDNPLTNIEKHYVTLGLLALNIVVFVVFQSGIVLPYYEAAASNFGLVPGQLLRVLAEGGPPEGITLFSYMFLHGDWMHLISNMIFLWVFGDNVEDAMGHLRYLVFYLACGIAAALTHAMMNPASDAPLIGASGAVAGIVAAYLILHPRVKVWVLFLSRVPIRLPAIVVLGFWVVLQFYYIVIADDGPVAWWAHIGGLAAGAILVLVLRRSGVPLFGGDQFNEP